MSVLAMLGASAIGSIIQSRSARSAANTQAQAARDASDSQVEAARVGARAMERNTQAGLNAARQSRDQALGFIGQNNDAALRSLASGRERSDNLVRSNTQDIIQGANQAYGEQYRGLNPFASAGRNALDGLMFELGMGSRPDGYEGFQSTPGYEFLQQEGQRAVDGSAASRGNLFSGATVRAQQDRGTGLANQTYQQFLDRVSGVAANGQNAANALAGFAGQRANTANNARQNRMTMMASNANAAGTDRANILMGSDQSRANAALGYGAQANSAMQNLGMNLANNANQVGNAQAEGFYNAGNATSAGQIGAGNAWSQGINNALGVMQYDNMFNGGTGMANIASRFNAPFLSPMASQANTAGRMVGNVLGGVMR